MRLGTGKGEEQVFRFVGVEMFDDWKNPGNCGSAHITEKAVYFVYLDKFDGIADSRLGVVSVIHEFDNNFATVDSSLFINLIKVSLCPSIKFDS